MPEDARDQWRELSPLVRWRVRRGLRRGSAVRDRKLAGTAAEYAASMQVEYGRRSAVWVMRVFAVVLLTIAIWAIARGDWLIGAIIAGGALFFAAMQARYPVLRDRMARAEAANRELARAGSAHRSAPS
jgi:hypothetical protein